MGKEIKFKGDAFVELKAGVDTVANAVKITLGSGGRNVALDKGNGITHITKDGVTVAQSVELDNPIQNMGAFMTKQVAQKTVDEAGDGTTTATLLTQRLVAEGYKMISAGVNPMEMKKGMTMAVKDIVAYLKSIAVEVGDDIKMIEQVATVSANNDVSIGKLISEAITQVKKDGIITVEEGSGFDTYVEVVEGTQFNRGFVSPAFIGNNEKGECILNNAKILIINGRFTVLQNCIAILEECVKNKYPLLIMAEDFGNEVLQNLIINKMRGILDVCLVKLPGYGEIRKDITQDIATLVGGVIVDEEKGVYLNEVHVEDLGSANRVIVNKNNTTIVGGHYNQQEFDERLGLIRTQIENAESPYDKEKLQERLAKMTGGVAVMYIGAGSEVEMKEKKDRVDDALAATRAAIEEGIVPGGGTAYIGALKNFNEHLENNDKSVGYNIVMKAIEAPTYQIAENSGKNGEMIVAKVKEQSKDGVGYNAYTDTFGDMVEMGIIDPVKVTRVALENAVSVASMILTTDCAIAFKQEKECSCENKC